MPLLALAPAPGVVEGRAVLPLPVGDEPQLPRPCAEEVVPGRPGVVRSLGSNDLVSGRDGASREPARAVVPPVAGTGNTPSDLAVVPAMTASVSMPLGGVQVGSYDSYEQAQAAVDYLADEKFAVENVTIIGTDLRMVETVTGRLTRSRAIGAGAAGGAWWGLFVGLLLGIFAPDGGDWVGAVLAGLLIGLVFGAVFGATGYAATRGKRDFTSTSRITAGRYDVMCNPAHAEEARALLARFSLRG